MSGLPAYTGSEPCTALPPDDYFAREGAPAQLAAAAACWGCRLRLPCLEYALAHEAFGVWGGLTPVERVRLGGVSQYRVDPAEPLELFLLERVGG